ncbi:hypothetical protein BGX34_010260 [Mortierella sp. NVP85]|nr:hypothetical protein BGX34_010260 [Mortierella sp. NVP85]
MVSPLLPPDIKVCQELDELVVQYMTLIDQHLSALNRVGDRFQQGREQISQAKYIMGPRNVSADCYDHRMKALRGVIVNSPKDIVLRDLWAEQKRAAKEKEEEAGQESGHGTGTEAMVDQMIHPGGLRRRGRAPSSASGSVTPSSSNDDDNVEEDRGKKRLGAGGMAKSFSLDSIATITTTTTTTAAAGAGAGAADGESTATTGTTKKKKKERNPDPLLWFGVFVPAPLRNAQSNFQKGKLFVSIDSLLSTG